jgi:hypothetical protein
MAVKKMMNRLKIPEFISWCILTDNFFFGQGARYRLHNTLGAQRLPKQFCFYGWSIAYHWWQMPNLGGSATGFLSSPETLLLELFKRGG